MKIQKSKHPLKLLEDLEFITKEIREFAKNSGLVIEVEPEEIKNDNEEETESPEKKESKFELIRFAYKNREYNFIFTLDDLKHEWEIGPQRYVSKFLYYRSPESENSTNISKEWALSNKIIEKFNTWISLLKRYDALKFIDPITKQYEDEIYENFQIIEDEADTTPFDTEQQIFLIRYLENSKKYLESKKGEYEVAEIIEEIDDLKESVTRLPKNASMKKVSTILAKSKKKGMELFKELMVMFKKDLMKKVLTEGYEYFDTIVKLLQG